MKNLFLYLPPLFPSLDHNAHLVLKLVPHMNCNSYAIAYGTAGKEEPLPHMIMNTPTCFVRKNDLLDKLLRGILRLLFGPAHGANYLAYLQFTLHSLSWKLRHRPHAVLSTYQWPYLPMITALAGRRTVKAIYLMDPTHAMCMPDMTAANESRWFLSVLKKHDIIFTTQFVREAMLSRGYEKYAKRIVDVSFPMLTDFPYQSSKHRDDKITLLFAGTIYSDIRSPEYFLKIVSKLDERFRVLFIGYNTRSTKSMALPETKAEIITNPPIPYEQILQEMANADILINIGNSVPVHLPSKVLEYINTGKPFVNFYKIDDCPSLSYTKRYPLCLNISEHNDDIDAVVAQFTDFCVNAKGKQLDREFLKNEFTESTPQYIARIISNELFRK